MVLQVYHPSCAGRTGLKDCCYLTYRKLTGADAHVSVPFDITRTGYLEDAHIVMLQHSDKRANVYHGP
jgi:hypothetical protein